MSLPETLVVRQANVHYFVSPGKRVVSRRSTEPTDELVVMLGGTYLARVTRENRTETIRAKAGDVVYWPADSTREEENDPESPTRCICVYFWWRNPIRGLPHLVHDSHHLIRMLADKLLLLKDSRPAQPPAVRNAFIAAMLAELTRLASLTGHDLAARVALYTEQHIREPFSLDALAHYIGLEKHHFGRRYRTLTGHTPMRDVREIRARHAINILHMNPKWTLKELAPRVGIRDEHQLGRILKRCAGIRVSDLRK